MPKEKREYGVTGKYHVTSRGVHRSIIFEDDQDHDVFLFLVDNAIEKFKHFNTKIHAYVLMDNHFHLLIEAGGKGISQVMKYIKERYATYYNNKYETDGPLYSGRFFSKPVDDDTYYIRTVKYILNNPVKAGICDKASEYKWSSYGAYFAKLEEEDINKMVDTSMVTELIESLDEFEEYINDGEIMDSTEFEPRMSHNTPTRVIQEVVEQVLDRLNLDTFRDLTKEVRNVFLQHLKREGILHTTISRITGIPVRIVRDA